MGREPGRGRCNAIRLGPAAGLMILGVVVVFGAGGISDGAFFSTRNHMVGGTTRPVGATCFGAAGSGAAFRAGDTGAPETDGAATGRASTDRAATEVAATGGAATGGAATGGTATGGAATGGAATGGAATGGAATGGAGTDRGSCNGRSRNRSGRNLDGRWRRYRRSGRFGHGRRFRNHRSNRGCFCRGRSGRWLWRRCRLSRGRRRYRCGRCDSRGFLVHRRWRDNFGRLDQPGGAQPGAERRFRLFGALSTLPAPSGEGRLLREQRSSRQAQVTIAGYPFGELSGDNLFNGARGALDLNTMFAFEQVDDLVARDSEHLSDLINPNRGQRVSSIFP